MVDIIDANGTDGLIKKYSLKVLEELGEHLTDEIMTDLNYQVDELQRSPKEVAKEFLQNEGLLPK
ncbi:glycine betaine ABC transporter substrate-binding protein [Clostridium sp. C105KSO13]|uniref:glycine betaine ABC transporter substrate-binding protein n=1 Tax=Clostridium sp. C105KSO13 TaxID=1776045 RepID=UPI000B7FD5E7|nr:glycine betaine ABC transporter substrate-binding protein [Clostridium sp. C105KSO13]